MLADAVYKGHKVRLRQQEGETRKEEREEERKHKKRKDCAGEAFVEFGLFLKRSIEEL